eukprot:m.552629 g.552629  ORF g.552629 m.552629 type:complete len:141 (+) comp22167_c0_seq9:154-576(+)
MVQSLVRGYHVAAAARSIYFRTGVAGRSAKRMASTGTDGKQYAVYDKHDPTPISFSKSAASDKSRRLDPLLGDHDQQSNTLPMIMVAVGFLLCGTLLYSFVTAEKMTKEENEEKTIKAMEDLGTLIESAARDPKAARTET